MFIVLSSWPQVIPRVHSVHFMNVDQRQAAVDPQTKSRVIWAVSPPVGSCRLQPPSPFIIINSARYSGISHNNCKIGPILRFDLQANFKLLAYYLTNMSTDMCLGLKTTTVLCCRNWPACKSKRRTPFTTRSSTRTSHWRTSLNSIVPWNSCTASSAYPALARRYVRMLHRTASAVISYAVVTTTSRFRFDGHSTAIRLLVKGH